MRGITLILLFFSFSVLSTFADSRVGQQLTVSYDGKAVLINGQRTFFIAGDVHYPRSSVGTWDRIMKYSVASGVNLIQIYTFWDLHEPQKGVYNFEGNADLIGFLTLAKSYGLFVNIRIGPYVCAEWTYGGLPVWLRNDPTMVFRTNNAAWKNEMQTWVTYLVNKLSAAKMWGPQGGPIIMAQMENEYGWVETAYGSAGTTYIQWAANLAAGYQLGVPWIMCAQNDVATVINTCNGYYCDSFPGELWQKYPNQPAMWTEAWIGWFQNWGEATPTRPSQDVAYSIARFVAKGGSYFAYYMWHGGTSFGQSAGGPYIITSYDYDAPLNEYGFPSEPKYSHLTNLHTVLNTYANLLFTGTHNYGYPATNIQTDAFVSGSNYLVFLENYGTSGSASISYSGKSYTVPAWSVTIVYNGNVLYNTATLPTTAVASTGVMNTVQSLSVNSYWKETIGIWDWSKAKVFSSPPEMITFVQGISDYMWYTTNTTLGDSKWVSVSSATHRISIFGNGLPGAALGTTGTLLDSSLTWGKPVNIQLLTSTVGLQGYALNMETYKAGIFSNVWLGPTSLWGQSWACQAGLKGESIQVYTTSGANSVTWTSGTVKSTPMVWYKLTFNMPSSTPSSTGYAVDLLGMGKGMAYINGHPLGRYWLIASGNTGCGSCPTTGSYDPNNTCRKNCNSYSQRFYHIPIDWLYASNNMLVLFEELGGDPSNVKLVSPTAAKSAFTLPSVSLSFGSASSSPATSAPVTPAPTTPAPTTPAPTTPAPATPAPATPAPATPAPPNSCPVYTPAPATQAPVTPAPATQAPVTPAPATQAPATPAPATKAPTTPAPATPAPATPAPTTPATTAPTKGATSAPVTPAPSTPAPSASAISVQLSSSSSTWWFSVSVLNDGGKTTKLELSDKGSYQSWSSFSTTNWGYWVFTPSSALVMPISLRLTSSSGSQIVLTNIYTSVSPFTAINTGKSY